jgi:transposase-like protein
MVSIPVQCRHYSSENVVCNGRTRNGKQSYKCNGKQSYKCKSCGRSSRENPQPQRYSAAHKEQIIRAYLERPSMRGIERIFGASRPTLIKWLKKRP